MWTGTQSSSSKHKSLNLINGKNFGKTSKMIRLRKNKLLPQQVSDLGAFLFVVTMIPVTYIWEVSKMPKTDSLKGLRLTSLPSFHCQAQAFIFRSWWWVEPYFPWMVLPGTFTWLLGWWVQLTMQFRHVLKPVLYICTVRKSKSSVSAQSTSLFV